MHRKLLLYAALAGGLAAQTTNYSYDSAGRLIEALYPDGTRLSYTYDPAGNMLRRLVTAAIQGPAPAASSNSVANAASFLGGPVAPGEMVTIFGTGIGPANIANYALLTSGYLDTYAGETKVLFDGIPGPLIYAMSSQTTVMVPYSVAGKSSTQMVIVYQGRSSAAITLPVAAAAPALFSSDFSGKGNGAIVNQDNSYNSPSNPADQGSVVQLYGTGEGQTSPAGVDGRIATAVFPKPVLPVRVTVGGINADVLYAGAAPYAAAGVFQINARIPQGVASGAVPIVVSVGTLSSQPNLTVSVR